MAEFCDPSWPSDHVCAYGRVGDLLFTLGIVSCLRSESDLKVFVSALFFSDDQNVLRLFKWAIPIALRCLEFYCEVLDPYLQVKARGLLWAMILHSCPWDFPEWSAIHTK